MADITNAKIVRIVPIRGGLGRVYWYAMRISLDGMQFLGWALPNGMFTQGFDQKQEFLDRRILPAPSKEDVYEMAKHYGWSVIQETIEGHRAPLPTSTLAVLSLTSAILGFTFIPVIGAVVALITGYLARKETRSIPPKADGDGFATTGIVMGWIQIGLFILGVCWLVAVFVFNLWIASNQ